MINSIRHQSLKNKNILLRVDLNVPFKDGKILDDTRIKCAIPTLKLILKNKGRPIILSHFGRPKGHISPELSLKHILPSLISHLGENIIFCNAITGNKIKSFIEKSPANTSILLENTRFLAGEETNDPNTGQMLANLGELFCNDAFSACHRAHASTVGVTKILPGFSGLLLEKELLTLKTALLKPKRPTVAIVGGSKVSTKISLLENLVKRVDDIIIGGGMANTFFLAGRKEIGKSIFEKDYIFLIDRILDQAERFQCKIHLPIDIVCSSKLVRGTKYSVYSSECCPPNKLILDSGPKTVQNIKTVLENCSTLIWNGPLGAFEVPPFDKATKEVAEFVAQLTKSKKIKSFAGGGDTVSALRSAGVFDDFTYVSNAGGAFLEWLEGKKLPGLKALESP